MASKKKTGGKKVKPASDQSVDQGIALLQNPRLSAKKKQELRMAAFQGIQTGEISFSQLCKISRA